VTQNANAIRAEREADAINFGEIPLNINELLQRGVVAYRSSPALADQYFQQALSSAPDVLPVYFCLYKIHTYQGDLTGALMAATQGLAEATRQAELDSDVCAWSGPIEAAEGPLRFALYTLKALAFIHLKRGARKEASRLIEQLRRLDPEGRVGWPVVADLMAGLP
jgi:tetratricopeptide (TPR) repeat protein